MSSFIRAKCTGDGVLWRWTVMPWRAGRPHFAFSNFNETEFMQ